MKKKILSILLMVILVVGLTGCGSKKNENENEPQKLAGISMTIKEGSLTNKSATVIIKDTNGKGTYVYGKPFRIDKKENGKWVTLKEINDDCAFILKAYYVDNDGLLELDQDWECMYGELEKGTYRLVKYTFLNSDTPVTDDDHRYFSVEFTIK